MNLLHHRKCIICGQEFTSVSNLRQYCSRECQKQAQKNRYHGRVSEYNRMCLYCGQPFTTYRSTKQCCCRYCSSQWQLKVRRDQVIREVKKECKWCHEIFMDSSSNKMQAYCSDVCRTKQDNERGKKKWLKKQKHYERLCKACGKFFIAHMIRKIYCSVECQEGISKRKRSIKSKEKIKQKPMMKKRCIICNTPFETRIRHKLCCHKDCSKEYMKREAVRKYREIYRPRKRAALEKKLKSTVLICKYCSNPFTPTSSNQVYCKPQCSKTCIQRKYQHKNNEKRRAKRRNNIQYRIKYNIYWRLRSVFNYKISDITVETLLGCSLAEYKKYIESKFYPHPETNEQMTWDNWAPNGWHIDHIIPLFAVDCSDKEQLIKVCNYKNTQPLWADENIKKNKEDNAKYREQIIITL